MKEYRILYISSEDGEEMEGIGHGSTGQEAVRDFLSWHYDCESILKVWN